MTARFFIVGDIHACPQELEALLTSLSLQPEDQLVCLGDYVDRGPGAREVVDLLLGLQADAVCDLTFLKGNHEDMFLDFLGYRGHYGEAFLFNGGNATVKSYGLSPALTGREAAAELPPAHLEFLLALKTLHPVGETLCVHAGVNPLRSLEEQSEEELLWIRQEFIFHPHVLPYTVVFGHTPQREVFFDLPYKVGIDTGLAYGGKLSCLEVTEKLLFQVARGSRKVKVTDVTDRWSLLPRLLS
ncbi:MAG: serine/threonine protein phosphatase [Deltaproteobacteria bacterium]|nr:serine/threonine protein phosphatase [Deltaproteobacteria bacterium]